MHSLSRFVRASIFVGLVAVAGVVSLVPKAGAETAAPDTKTDISKQVKHQLAMLPWYGAFDNLGFQVNGSEVILSGAVVSEHDQTKYSAASLVEKVPGVTKVVNNIEVLPLSSFDDRIRRSEYRAVFSQSDLGRYTQGAIPQVHIIVKGGHVFLEGTVMNKMDKTVAGIAANSVAGVFSVTNNLRIG